MPKQCPNVPSFFLRCNSCFCHVCKRFYPLNGMPHLCQLSAPKEQRFWNLLAFWDVESTICPETGTHQINAIAVSKENREKPGSFDMTTLYSDDMAHPKDMWREEEDYFRRTCPESLTKVPLRKKPKNLSGGGGVFKENDEEEAEREAVLGVGAEVEAAAERDLRAAAAMDFFSTEAAEAAGSTDESEYEGQREEEDERRREGTRRGAEGPTRPKKLLDSKPVSTALEKFLRLFVNENSYGTTFIAHNSGELVF